MSFLSADALRTVGFRSLGRNVLISERCAIHGAGRISFGDNVRIDDFTLLTSGHSGSIALHNHIHIAPYSSLYGAAGIVMEDFSGLSSYVAIYSASDDYSGEALIGPVMDPDCLNIVSGAVTIGRYATVGSHSVVLPGVTMEEGSVLGANSLASKSLNPWTIYAGTPARPLKARSRGLLEKARLMEERWRSRP